MSRNTNGKDAFDIEKEFEEELKKEKRPEESFLPEETEFEKGYEEEMKGKEPPKKKELDPFAEKFYELSTRKFKSETELDNAVNAVLNEIERECFFKGLLAKTTKGGKLLLKKGVAMFEGLQAFQAANAVTQLARGNLKGILGSLAKSGIKGMQTGTTIPVLKALGFEAGTVETEQNRDAWQNFTNVCKESFDRLARNLHENADDPVEASKLASETFSAALKKIQSELKAVAIQKRKKMVVVQPSPKRAFNRTVTLALGLICIVLGAGLIGAIAYYSPITTDLENLKSQITEKDNLISSMNATIVSLQNSLNQSGSSSAAKDAQIAALSRQISSLFNYLNLNVTDLLVYNETLYQEASGNTSLYYDMVQFAGFINVEVQSTSNTTYIRLAYSSFGVNFDSNMTVGLAGTAAFPVLPGLIDLRIGNTDTGNSTVAAMVTATYTY